MPDLSDDNMKMEVESCIRALDRIHMEVIAINTMHPLLKIPSFYTIIPGAHFRERAAGNSVGLFAAKLIAENHSPLEALDRLRDMDELMPGKYYVKFFMGISFLSMDEPSEALKFFEKALDLDPKREDIASIYSYMGQCLKAMEKYQEAIEVLEKAEAYDPDRTDIHNLKGFCYFKNREHEKAIECFRRVLQLDPSSAIDYANIASNYRDMGDREQAVRYYRLALELDPTIDFARESLSRLLDEAS
jgi:ribosomal protein S12 methylthiotransferase accessory factor